MGIGMATAQTATITGKVYSEADGEPVFGASVFVIGTTVGASTDIDGNFTIENVPATATTLRVSYVGMTTQEVQILRNKPMKIMLVEDGVSLDEVVVTAYGTQKKGSFTGSSATIKAENLENLQVSAEEIEAEYGKLAEAYNLEADKVRELVDSSDIKKDLSVNKAVQIIKAAAKISE